MQIRDVTTTTVEGNKYTKCNEAKQKLDIFCFLLNFFVMFRFTSCDGWSNFRVGLWAKENELTVGCRNT